MIKLFLVLSSLILRNRLVASNCSGLHATCQYDTECCGHPANQAIRCEVRNIINYRFYCECTNLSNMLMFCVFWSFIRRGIRVLENDAKKEGNMTSHVKVVPNASRKHVLMDYAFLGVELKHQ